MNGVNNIYKYLLLATPNKLGERVTRIQINKIHIPELQIILLNLIIPNKETILTGAK